MELQHIVIRSNRLLLAAQAHEERPIYTALKSYDIHDLDPPLPPPLENLYVWLKWETLFSYYNINRLSKTLTFVPLFFLPICIAVGRIWWLFFVISILFSFVGVFCQQMYRQNFFYQRLEDFLKQQSFDIVDNKIIEYLPEVDALQKSVLDLEREMERMNIQIGDLQNIFQKLQREKATEEQLATLTLQIQNVEDQKQVFVNALEQIQESQKTIEQSKKHVLHDIQIQYASKKIVGNERALTMLKINLPSIKNQIEDVRDIITKKQIEQEL
jgi:hypothetical protein